MCPLGAAAGEGPDHEAGFGLVEVPAGGLLGAVGVSAERSAIAFARPSALTVCNCVVEVAAVGGAQAPRLGAGALADGDEVAQGGRRPVAGCLALVGAGPGLEVHRPQVC